MSVDQQIIVDGHLKSQLLHDFVEAPDAFDDDAVEEIWKHLDECEGCMEDYEAIGKGGLEKKEEPAAPPADSVEPDRFAPDELADATIKTNSDNNDDQINGLMPVGDDPERNGLPVEYRENQPETKELEFPGEIVPTTETETDEPEEVEDPGETSGESCKAPAIEGLITGEITASDKPVERMITETLADNEVRTSRERIQASLLKEIDLDPEPPDETNDEDEQEIEHKSVDKPEYESFSDIETGTNMDPGTELTDTKQHEPESAIETPPPAEPAAELPRKKPRSQPSKPAKPRPPVVVKQEPLEEFFTRTGAFLKRPQTAIICGVVIAAAVTAILFSMNVFGPSKKVVGPVAGWEPLNIIETRVPLQEVLMRKMRRGRIPAARGVDLTLDFRGINRLVIAVDLDFIKGKTLPHDAIVRNPAGKVLFQEAIPQIYLDDGRFFLRLLPRLFEVDQKYTLELTAGSADGSMRVIAQSVFDVLK